MISQGTKDLYIVKAGYDEHISVNNDEIEDSFTRKVDLSEYSSMTSYCYRIDKIYIGKSDESEPTSEISNEIDVAAGNDILVALDICLHRGAPRRISRRCRDRFGGCRRTRAAPRGRGGRRRRSQPRRFRRWFPGRSSARDRRI